MQHFMYSKHVQAFLNRYLHNSWINFKRCQLQNLYTIVNWYTLILVTSHDEDDYKTELTAFNYFAIKKIRSINQRKE